MLIIIILILALIIILLAIIKRRLNLETSKLTIIIGLLIFLFLASTYGQWEVKTLLYDAEFRPFIEKYQNQPNSLMSQGIEKLKVFSYSDNKASVFVKDKEGNKWLLSFQKEVNSHQWDTYFNGSNHIEILHSKRGGSADQMFYWY